MATLLTLISTFLLHVALVVSAISFITDHWAEVEFGNCGLWSICFLQNCRWFYEDIEILDIERRLPGWFVFTQGLVTLALLCQVLAVLLSCFNLCKQVKCLVITIVTVTLLSSLLMVCALSIFAYWVYEQRDAFLRRLEAVSWSYYLCILATVLLLADAVMFIVTLYTRRNKKRRKVVTYRRNVTEDKLRSLDELPGYDDMI